MLFVTHDIEESLLLADVIHVMTARPGRFKEAIEVDLPRPRSPDVTMSPEFNVMKRRIRDLIRMEAIQAETGRG